MFCRLLKTRRKQKPIIYLNDYISLGHMKYTSIISIIILISVGFQSIMISEGNTQETTLPSSFSWTDIDGVNYVTPIRDQSPAPTCEAYALCAIIETMMQYETKTIFNPDLSEAHLYFYAGGTYQQGGVRIQDAANYLITNGVPDEGCFPDPHRPFDFPFSSIPGWENRTMRITDWGYVPNDEEAIKQALIEHGPLTICIFVYDDMYSYKGGVYWKTEESKRVGGHLVALVGYDDATQSWLVKNSWGTHWGDNGWFHMGYDESMFIDGCYGGESGVIYIDGIYGVYEPETPIISIENPKIKNTYLFGNEFFSILSKIPGIQEAAPRIIGPIDVRIQAEHADMVECYLDGTLETTLTESPYEWRLKASFGIHTIETIAYNEYGISKDVIDVFFFF
jgi:hypothetical protein